MLNREVKNDAKNSLIYTEFCDYLQAIQYSPMPNREIEEIILLETYIVVKNIISAHINKKITKSMNIFTSKLYLYGSEILESEYSNLIANLNNEKWGLCNYSGIVLDDYEMIDGCKKFYLIHENLFNYMLKSMGIMMEKQFQDGFVFNHMFTKYLITDTTNDIQRKRVC